MDDPANAPTYDELLQTLANRIDDLQTAHEAIVAMRMSASVDAAYTTDLVSRLAESEARAQRLERQFKALMAERRETALAVFREASAERRDARVETEDAIVRALELRTSRP